MAKVKNPTTFSAYYSISHETLDEIGVFNPTLAIDSKLFVDPLLLKDSTHTEIKNLAVELYEKHFIKIINLLAIPDKDDPNKLSWRNAKRLFQFHEIRGTCLGYGATTISGSGFGTQLIARVMSTAKNIVKLGIDDPDLFVALALFEEDIGPDRISDMTTNVIIDALISFNKRVLEEINIKGEKFNVLGRECRLAINPFQSR